MTRRLKGVVFIALTEVRNIIGNEHSVSCPLTLNLEMLR